ncbi:MAG: ATP-binding protein [Leptolyngbyaceae cyanobacterium bins.349]|nr:ATP-binding protein [Leptolyngbyaceae cyanobacterium bins.349]
MTTPKILVVEDEVIVARTITSQLQQLGYIVVDTASSGASAIAKASETQPDLILMDIVLKGEMDGVTAANQIQAQQNVPIIYLTAYADDNTLQRAKYTQPLGYIVKPFTANDLRVAIEIGLYKYQVSQELQESRDYLATLLRSMGDAVVATDDQGAITFMNPAAETLTEWPQSEAAGRPATEILQLIDEVTELPVNPVAQVLQEQRVVHLNDFTALISKNGTPIPIGDSASPLRRTTGEVSGAVLVFWDMSDRRQAEVLTQALEKEQELNRLKSQFVSTVSHEFRNPLAAVLIAAELLEKSQNLTEAKKDTYLQRIKTAVRSMNQLMEDVLILGQAEVDRLLCQPIALNLELFCRDLVEEFSLIKQSEHTIVFNCIVDSPTEDIRVRMDEKLLRYILTNLLSNAVKYSPLNTAVDFTLTIDHLAHTATFQIADQGIGIPEADQPRLFDSFFRASNVASIQGTGLGLAIVKRCVEAHNGTLTLSSQVGVGTTIGVVLPLGTEP